MTVSARPDFSKPIDFVEESGKLLRLVRERSYREGDFTLASGKKSKFYIDMKATTLSAEGAFLLGRLGYDVIRRFAETRFKSEGGVAAIHAVGGLTLGADPIATAVSLAAYSQGRDWPAFIVRKEAKGHGTGRYVEGREN